MKIAMVASEINPLCKSGGLADVVYALSKELVVSGEEVICVLPFYKSIKDAATLKFARVGTFTVNVGWRRVDANVYKTYIDGILYYLIDNETYFGRDSLYGYFDDGERFAFFTMAAAGLFEFVGFKPDVIHIHDWQPGMLPVVVREGLFPYVADSKFVLTIHNEAFQGMLDRYFLNDFYCLSDYLYDCGAVRFYDQVSTLKAAIVYCDKVTTVSPSHAQELLTEVGGKGLHEVLAQKGENFVGIVNGIDQGEWDPSSDPFIVKNYGPNAFKTAKKDCKTHLLSSFGMDVSESKPVYGIVSRLTSQKGLGLVLASAEGIVKRGGALVVLGSGEYGLEEAFESLHRQYPKQVGYYRGYSFQLAHDIYAGADFFLMPSLFEPCGIGQMIAERYGTLPIVRETGGLKDTVVAYRGDNANEATGFSFADFDLDGIGYAIELAEKTMKDKKVFGTLVKNALKADHSWAKPCREYLNLYLAAIGR